MKLLDSVTSTTTGDMVDGYMFGAFQATVVGTGSVSATVIVEASIDSVGWVALGTMSISGTSMATDAFAMGVGYRKYRARCTAISGAGAQLTVTAVA